MMAVVELGLNVLQTMMGLSLMGQALIHLVVNLKTKGNEFR